MIYFRTSGIRSVGTLTHEDTTWTFKTKRESLVLKNVRHVIEVKAGIVVIGDKKKLFVPCKEMVRDGDEDAYVKDFAAIGATKCTTQISGDFGKCVFVHEGRLYTHEKSILYERNLSSISLACVERFTGSHTRSFDVNWVLTDNTVFQQTVLKKEMANIRAMCQALNIELVLMGGDPLPWKKYSKTAVENQWTVEDWKHALCLNEDEGEEDEGSEFEPDECSEDESEDEESDLDKDENDL